MSKNWCFSQGTIYKNWKIFQGEVKLHDVKSETKS